MKRTDIGRMTALFLTVVLTGCGGGGGTGAPATPAASTVQEAPSGTASGAEWETAEIYRNQIATPSGSLYYGDETFVGLMSLADTEFYQRYFELNVDPATTLAPLTVSDPVTFSVGGTSFESRIFNPYAEEKPLSACLPVSIEITDTTGYLHPDPGIRCGTTTRQEILDCYEPHWLFLETEDTLIYKKREGDGRETNTPYSVPIDREFNVVFHFENDILTRVHILRPFYRYYGLLDNFSIYELEQMTQEEIDALLTTRDSVLDRLQQAFSEADVRASIDDRTGTVSLRNDILFDVDSAELKPDSRAYLDTFFAAYASVMLDASVAEVIDGIVFDGHTDTSGEYDHNLTLSSERAESVLQYCLESMENGLSEEDKAAIGAMAGTVGHASDQPVYAEDGEIDMDASRRVTVRFVLRTEVTAPEETSTNARGVGRITNEGSPERLMLRSTVMLVGDRQQIWNMDGNVTDHTAESFTSSDESVLRVLRLNHPTSGKVYHVLEAVAPGEVMLSARLEGSDEVRQIRMVVVAQAEDATLTVTADPAETVFTHGSGEGQDVMYRLSGTYSGSVMPHAYVSSDNLQDIDGDWIDNTTLSVHIGLSYPFYYGEDEVTFRLILTPDGDPATVLNVQSITFREGN